MGLGSYDAVGSDSRGKALGYALTGTMAGYRIIRAAKTFEGRKIELTTDWCPSEENNNCLKIMRILMRINPVQRIWVDRSHGGHTLTVLFFWRPKGPNMPTIHPWRVPATPRVPKFKNQRGSKSRPIRHFRPIRPSPISAVRPKPETQVLRDALLAAEKSNRSKGDMESSQGNNRPPRPSCCPRPLFRRQHSISGLVHSDGPSLDVPETPRDGPSLSPTPEEPRAIRPSFMPPFPQAVPDDSSTTSSSPIGDECDCGSDDTDDSQSDISTIDLTEANTTDSQSDSDVDSDTTDSQTDSDAENDASDSEGNSPEVSAIAAPQVALLPDVLPKAPLLGSLLEATVPVPGTEGPPDEETRRLLRVVDHLRVMVRMKPEVVMPFLRRLTRMIIPQYCHCREEGTNLLPPPDTLEELLLRSSCSTSYHPNDSTSESATEPGRPEALPSGSSELPSKCHLIRMVPVDTSSQGVTLEDALTCWRVTPEAGGDILRMRPPILLKGPDGQLHPGFGPRSCIMSVPGELHSILFQVIGLSS